ncbi:MAG TPA: hypothetical protein VFS00_11820, partial [Polyangiaceae bacterium]|nr:hypothetical protein [Polyangiaceae bacterium]
MLLRTSLSSFRLTLLSALGVLPVAGCAFPESGSDGPTYSPVCTPAPGGARENAGYEYCLEGFSHRPEQKGCVDLAAVACRGGNPDASTCAT